MTRLLAPACLWLGIALAGPAHADDDAFIVGVGTHLLNGTHLDGSPVSPLTLDRSVQMIQDAGIGSVRDDAFWSTIEGIPGALRIPRSWDDYMQLQKEHALNNVLILGYGNQFYANNAKPITAPVRDAFAAYVDYVTRQYKGQVDYYEVWNEWDIEDPKGKTFSDAYAKLIKDTAVQVRRNDPKARLLAGSVTSQGLDEEFADRLVKAGVMNQLDGLSIHPYVHCRKRFGGNTPESWIQWLGELDQRLTRIANKPVPLYLTEMSWPSAKEPCGVSESTQAAFLARAYFLARTLPSIKGMWWYDLYNDGMDPKEREHNFGLLTLELNEKPAYATLKAIAPVVSGYRYDGALSQQDGKVYQLHFSRGKEQLLVAWSSGQSVQATVSSVEPITGGVRLIDTRQPKRGRFASGSEWKCSGDSATPGCTATVTLDEFPRIITLGDRQ